MTYILIGTIVVVVGMGIVGTGLHKEGYNFGIAEKINFLWILSASKEKQLESNPASTTVKIDGVQAGGSITGVSGKTSDEAIRKMFEGSVDIGISDSSAKGDVTGLDLKVDQYLEAKGPMKIETDTGSVEFNPTRGKLEFGGTNNLE